mmetsp:Transcript_30567/g.47884  ORF Transcript_30567/g.47884 Transcript_30567/m.47884 type:complete len:112 (-) Transcript_30567:904-1239(-)
MQDVLEAIARYPPGQANIDGGGFKTFKQEPNYVWVQFESAKHGYIDDFELAFVKEGEVLVRSASRRGYLDYTVNSRRVNWFAKELSSTKGWKCEIISEKSHPDYFAQNSER